MVTAVQNLITYGKIKVQCFLAKKPGDSQIVVALVLIAVAIGLCIIFRNQIYAIMNSLFNQIGTAINNLSAGSLTEAAGGTTPPATDVH